MHVFLYFTNITPIQLMNSLRNVIFYIVVILTFSGLLFFFVRAGQSLEVTNTLPVQGPSDPNVWQQFTETLQNNIGHPLALLLLQMAAIILAARLLGMLCGKIGQPSVIGEIAAGILLGPSFAGHFLPEGSSFLFPAQSLDNLQFLSQIGLILFMFIIGMELDLKVLKTKAQEAIVISHASIMFPFALGVGLAQVIYQQFAPEGISFLSFSLFIGIALSITAFPVLARIVQERGLSRTRLGTMVITCAAIDDISAWCLLAVVVAIVKAVSVVTAILTIALSILYVFAMLLIVKPLLQKVGDHYAYREGLTKPVVGLFFLMLLFSSYATEVIGIHALFGAFMAGVVMPANQRFRNIFIEKMEDVALVLLLPLFFVFTGLRTQIGLLNDQHTWQITGLVILVAVIGKFVGSTVAARFVKLSWRDSLIIGSLMNTRGLMELVVLNIGYDIGVLSPQIFAMMVVMALVTTCMTGPALDLVNRFFPETKTVLDHIPKLTGPFTVLIAFASPQGGRKMLRIARVFTEKVQQSNTPVVSALHLSPSSYLSPVETDEYQAETFEPIQHEAQILNVSIEQLFKPSKDIPRDIVETVNTRNFDMLMIGIGHSVFEGTVIGKILGITSKMTSPVRLLDSITGKRKFFHQDLFDEKTTQLIKNVKASLAILIDKNLQNIDKIIVPVFTPEDIFLTDLLQRIMLNDKTKITVADLSGVFASSEAPQNNIPKLVSATPTQLTIKPQGVMEQSLLHDQDLMIISMEAWKTEVENHSEWLSHIPSVLIIRPALPV
jgi:Kef-type K+ transport system membrane component KefB